MSIRKFAFIVHLRGIEDIAYTIPFIPNWVITKLLRRPILWLMWKLHGRWGFMVRSKFRVTDQVQGYIIVIWLTGAQIMNSNHNGWVRKRVLETILYAQNKLHCDVVGLGALTASVTNAGQWLVSRPEVTTAVTHGDTYAVALTLEAVEKLANLNSLILTTIAVVGATGIIGEALSKALAPITGKLILIGRKMERFAGLRKSIEGHIKNGKVVFATNIGLIRDADIVITATSWPEAIIKAEHLKQGAIVYEVSQPRNVPRSLIKERPDAIVIDGSYARVPEEVKFWWMSLPPHHTFGCMVETIMQCLEGDQEHHVGAIDLSFIEEVRRRAQKYGYTHAEFSSFNKFIPQIRIIRLGGLQTA